MSMKMTRLSPGATTMIRMDHTHVLATFHRYRIDGSAQKKRAIADLISPALEIHARLEEEIFYPAMRRYDPDLVEKSVPEHNEMRRLIARLSGLSPDDSTFDTTVMELMRNVMRHVADEETILLPDAERVLGAERLSELGVQMTWRRFELAGPRAGEIAVTTVRTFPGIHARDERRARVDRLRCRMGVESTVACERAGMAGRRAKARSAARPAQGDAHARQPIRERDRTLSTWSSVAVR
jgi:hemerythrin-like domain-containing protein